MSMTHILSFIAELAAFVAIGIGTGFICLAVAVVLYATKYESH